MDSDGLGWTRMDSDGLGWTRMRSLVAHDRAGPTRTRLGRAGRADEPAGPASLGPGPSLDNDYGEYLARIRVILNPSHLESESS
jgi:hypothetical protein